MNNDLYTPLLVNSNMSRSPSLMKPKNKENSKNLIPSRNRHLNESLESATSESNFQNTNSSTDPRNIIFGLANTQNNLLYPKNQILTAKYTLYNFIPLNLFEQVTKIANLYFIILGFLQIIPSISITQGKPTMFLPLSIVIIISCIKDFIEDRKRQTTDKKENYQNFLKFNPETKEYENIISQELQVGDIVKIQKNSMIPADLILLSSANKNNGAYVETKNLDGETNLKYKESHIEIQKHIEKNFSHLVGEIICPVPSDKMYEFNGSMRIGSEKIPLDYNNFLLRGSTLKDTDWIIGIIIYTSNQCKIQMNSSKTKSKKSFLERMTGYQIILIFVLQNFMCFACALSGTIIQRSSSLYNNYLEYDSHHSFIISLLQSYGTWLLLTNQIIPISLLVTLEIVRYSQGLLLCWDASMYNLSLKMFPAVQSSNLNEELGRITYIFSDKTGTLTCNEMKFVKISVNGKIYGDKSNEEQQSYLNIRNQSRMKGISNVNFKDESFFDLLKSKPSSIVNIFLLAMAMNHTIMASINNEELIYHATSPDEFALVNAAKLFEYCFQGKNEEGIIYLKIRDENLSFKFREIIPFSYTRKRMSIIVSDEKGKNFIFTKGADSVLFPLLSKDSEYISETSSNLDKFGAEGLRTLVYAYKEIDENSLKNWMDKYKEELCKVPRNISALEKISTPIESNLILLGATAIEDQLQNEVPETITFIKQAGIKIWILTGDKKETAINIGFSCNLLDNSFNKIILDSIDLVEIENLIIGSISNINAENNYSKNALIISGDTYTLVHNSNLILSRFAKLCKQVNIVIGCRFSPKQKADIINLIKKYEDNSFCLAIGDGANDVNMITTANIGVGIRGSEGQQAAKSSDYVLTEFKQLKNLIFAHGREFNRKNSFLTCYSFYKNILVVAPNILYGIFSMFSGKSIYEDWIYQLFNTVFTAVPVAWFAIFDKEKEREELLTDPSLYEVSKNGDYFSYLAFWGWIIYGLIHSCFIFFSIFITLNNSIVKEGIMSDLGFFGCFVFTVIILQANIKILTSTNTHNPGSLFFAFGTMGVYILIFLLFTTSASLNVYKAFGRLFSNLTSFLLLILIIMTLILTDNFLSKINLIFSKYLQLYRSEIINDNKKKANLQNVEESFNFHNHGYAFSQESSNRFRYRKNSI